MNKKEAIFVTGVTGLVGSYLLTLLLQKGYKVYALARSKGGQEARSRIKSAIEFWDKDCLFDTQQNLVTIEGDIRVKNLSMPQKILELLTKEIKVIFHCAALTKFNASIEESRAVNVEGTKNILNLAVKWNRKGKLKKVNHISTAFVCGDYKGVFKESDLDVGQKFNTTYEQSKFEAEKLIDLYRNKGVWIDVFRPCAIIGESFTGKIPMFNYALYQLIHVWSKGLLDYFPKGYALKMVFVDELCRSILCISSKEFEKNKCYHPFSSDFFSIDYFLNLAVEHFKFNIPHLLSRKEVINRSTPLQMMLLKYNLFFINTEVKIDSRKTNKILKSCNFQFSQFTEQLLLNILSYLFKIGFIVIPK